MQYKIYASNTTTARVLTRQVAETVIKWNCHQFCNLPFFRHFFLMAATKNGYTKTLFAGAGCTLFRTAWRV